MKRYLFFFAGLLMAVSTSAQSQEWREVSDMFDKQSFSAAQHYLSSVNWEEVDPRNAEEALYMQAACAMRLFQEDAVFQLERYIRLYPLGKFKSSVYDLLGQIYFREKDFARASAKFVLVELEELKEEDKAMFHFRSGYASFVEEDYESAKMSFHQLYGVSFSYKDLTAYYVSHMAYLEGNYATAYKGFESLLSTPGLGNIAQYYIAQIYYFQERYDELLAFAQPILDSVNNKRSPEIARLIGDSYYQLQAYDSSITYLQRYQQSTTLPTSREDKYQLAYAYYQLEQFDSSATLFQEVLQEEDSLSQFAAYHLADCYLRAGQKGYAMQAFDHAAGMSFDDEIKENAAFNHAKLVYEQEVGLESAVEVFQQFIADFPVSEHLPLVYDYLMKAYAVSNSYKEAIQAMDALNELTYEQRRAYQRMAYFRGVELYNSSSFEEAIKSFDKSDEFDISPSFSALCAYWRGESMYALKMYEEAEKHFKKFLYASGSFRLPEYVHVYYSLGYSAYQQKDYKGAVSWFRKYIKNTEDKDRNNDACLRVADSYFMQKNYDRAVDFYAQAEELGSFDVDYAIYQQSLCLGLLGELAKKQAALGQLIAEHATSPYVDDAKFNLAATYGDERQEEAKELLGDVVQNHPYSPLVKKALMQLGLMAYNADQSEEAVKCFKKVIEDYPSTAESGEALVGLKNVYVEAGDVQSYFDYVGTLSNVSVSESSQDSITYEAAELLYVKEEYDRAIQAFGDYLQNFESALFKTAAHYYRAEAKHILGHDDALADYLQVLESPTSPWMSRALEQAARLEYAAHDFAIAAFHYTQLEEQAQDNSVKREAIIALMRCHKMLNEKEAMLKAANKVMALDKLSDELKVEASLLIAHAAFEQSEYHLAHKHYTWIVEQTQAEEGAVAQYRLASILFLQEQYTETEEAVYELAEKFSSDHYIARGFMLLAKVYKEQGNLFQAKATLESVIEHHEGVDLKAEAKQQLEALLAYEESLQSDTEEQEIIIDFLEDLSIQEWEEEEENDEDNEE